LVTVVALLAAVLELPEFTQPRSLTMGGGCRPAAFSYNVVMLSLSDCLSATTSNDFLSEQRYQQKASNTFASKQINTNH
jgi:hypothetical protein